MKLDAIWTLTNSMENHSFTHSEGYLRIYIFNENKSTYWGLQNEVWIRGYNVHWSAWDNPNFASLELLCKETRSCFCLSIRLFWLFLNCMLPWAVLREESDTTLICVTCGDHHSACRLSYCVLIFLPCSLSLHSANLRFSSLHLQILVMCHYLVSLHFKNACTYSCRLPLVMILVHPTDFSVCVCTLSSGRFCHFLFNVFCDRVAM